MLYLQETDSAMTKHKFAYVAPHLVHGGFIHNTPECRMVMIFKGHNQFFEAVSVESSIEATGWLCEACEQIMIPRLNEEP